MPASRPVPAPVPVCGHCDGFPVVHIATGPRTTDGTLPTLAVFCPVCRGTGRYTPATRPTAARVGR